MNIYQLTKKLKMKKRSLLAFFVVVILFSCKNNTTKVDLSKYPETLQNVFTKHGGLEHWNEMNALTFELMKEEGNETHQIDLKSRRDRVEGTNFIMGNDGTNIWLEADTSYKGNAAFYHNLMFYFYAMPFVLADDGIIYSEADSLHFEGKSYPGIHIAFENGVGQVSTDEYIIYYDAETYQMTWLGYTVTFKTKEKSDNFKWIRYDDWQSVDGFALPNSMTWYNVENDSITTPRGSREFENVIVGNRPFSDDVFEQTENAAIIE